VGTDKIKPLTLLSRSTQTGINPEKYTFCVIKALEQQKKLKTCRVPQLGLEQTMYVIKSQIHPVRQFLKIQNKEDFGKKKFPWSQYLSAVIFKDVSVPDQTFKLVRLRILLLISLLPKR